MITPKQAEDKDQIRRSTFDIGPYGCLVFMYTFNGNVNVVYEMFKRGEGSL